MDRIIGMLMAAVITVSGCSFGKVSESNKNENILEGKTIAFVGDSISYGTNFHGGYGALIGSQCSMTVTNTSKGGATIAENVPWSEGADGARPYIYDLLTDASGTDYDYVILEGGVNDFWAHVELGALTEDFEADFDTSTYAGGLEKLLSATHELYPDSKIGYVIIHDPFTYNAEDGFEPYYEMTKAACEKWGVPYLDLYSQNNTETGVNVKDAEQNKLYFASNDRPDGDGCHPNELGYQTIYVEPMIPWLKAL